MQIAEVLKQEKTITAASVISGAGFNGNSPDQGLFFFGLKPLDERSGSDNKAPAIVDRLNAKLSRFSTGLAAASQPPAIPGFSAQGVSISSSMTSVMARTLSPSWISWRNSW